MKKFELRKHLWAIPAMIVLDICVYMFILWCNIFIGPVIEPGGAFDKGLMLFWTVFCLLYIPIKIFLAFPIIELIKGVVKK